MLRRSARCTEYGGKGATVQIPGWGGLQAPVRDGRRAVSPRRTSPETLCVIYVWVATACTVNPASAIWLSTSPVREATVSLESVKGAVAIVVLGAVLVVYVLAGGAIIYFSLVTLVHAVAGHFS